MAPTTTTTSSGLCDRSSAAPYTTVSLKSIAAPWKPAAEKALGIHIPDKLFDQFCVDAQTAMNTAWTGQTEEQLMLEKQWLEFLHKQGWEQQQWIAKQLSKLEAKTRDIAEARDKKAEQQIDMARREAEAQNQLEMLIRERKVQRLTDRVTFEHSLEDQRTQILREQDQADLEMELEQVKARREDARAVQREKFEKMKNHIDQFESLVLEEACQVFLGNEIRAKREEKKQKAKKQKEEKKSHAQKLGDGVNNTVDGVAKVANSVVEAGSSIIHRFGDALDTVNTTVSNSRPEPKSGREKEGKPSGDCYSGETEQLKQSRVRAMVEEMMGEIRSAEAQSVLATQAKALAELETRGQAADKRIEFYKTQDEIKKREDEYNRQVEADKEAAILEAESQLAHAQQAADMKQIENVLTHNQALLNQQVYASTQMLEQVKLVEVALLITPDHMKEAKAAQCRVQFAKMVFLAVIVGCELDLYGFVLAFTDYWSAGADTHWETNAIMRIMLVVGPIGYFLATLMYILANSESFLEWSQETFGAGPLQKVGLREELVDPESHEKVRIRDAHLLAVQKTSKSPSSRSQCNNDPTVAYDRMLTEATREKVMLKFFHFLPLVRYFLLVKDPASNDVESLFRVNALSTFTLGFAQVFCMMLGISNGSLVWNIKIRVGEFAQVVNGSMTLLYFFTSFPARMKTQMSVEALQSQTARAMQEEFVRYTLVAEQTSNRLGFEFPNQLQLHLLDDHDRKLAQDVIACRCKVIRDINQMGNCALAPPLEQFSTTQLFEWRAKLSEKNIAAYGKLV